MSGMAETRRHKALCAFEELAYDGMGYITSTGDWQITNDYLGRTQTGIGFGVL